MNVTVHQITMSGVSFCFPWSSTCFYGNLNPDIIEKISSMIHLRFVEEKYANEWGQFDSYDVMDYLYAYLYSPAYQKKYADLIKSEFARVPFPISKEQFIALVGYGRRLRKIHLLDTDDVVPYSNVSFVGSGDCCITNYRYEDKRIYINKNQYFVADESTWNYYIGGYNPLQKWLKDRKGCVLTLSDIEHYKQMIAAIQETQIIVQEIDKFVELQN